MHYVRQKRLPRKRRAVHELLSTQPNRSPQTWCLLAKVVIVELKSRIESMLSY